MHIHNKQNLRYITMTKEQYQRLKRYEHVFYTAIYGQYYRAMTSRDIAEFVQVCKELAVYINTSCPACVLKAFQTVGKLYYDYKPEPETKEENSIQEREIKSDIETITPKKKASQNASKNKKKSK